MTREDFEAKFHRAVKKLHVIDESRPRTAEHIANAYVAARELEDILAEWIGELPRPSDEKLAELRKLFFIEDEEMNTLRAKVQGP